jgi:hypothetical protein
MQNESGLMREQYVIHHLRLVDDARRRKLHLIEDVLSDIDAFGNFRQHETFSGHFEYSPFGNDLGALAAVDYAVTDGISDLLGGVDKLSNLPLFTDVQNPIVRIDLQSRGRESSGEQQFARVMSDIDKTTRARIEAAEFADVHISV